MSIITNTIHSCVYYALEHALCSALDDLIELRGEAERGKLDRRGTSNGANITKTAAAQKLKTLGIFASCKEILELVHFLRLSLKTCNLPGELRANDGTLARASHTQNL
jgi:hypothetical protein